MRVRPQASRFLDTEADDGAPVDLARAFARILGILDFVSVLTLVGYTFFWPGISAAWLTPVPIPAMIAILYAATGLPALALGVADRMPRLALSLGLAFPVGFMLLYSALAIAAAG
jgi:hypothetical protein